MSLSGAGLVHEFLAEKPAGACLRLKRDFLVLAHRHQEPPAYGNNGEPWTTWLMLGGRGAGKTRLGAEWVRALVMGRPPYAEADARHIALVGETEHDVREVMIEGPAGLMRSTPRSERPQYTSSRKRLEWPNGAVAYAFSAEDPEQLRGPQFDAAWCDELAKWKAPDAVFDMLQFGLRLGERPRQLVTTTPRSIALIKRLLEDPRTAVTRASTHANRAFLAPAFFDAVIGRYEGTRTGRQEIDGEVIEERTDGLWTRAVIEAARVDSVPPLRRVVVGLDPPASSREGADLCGIVAAGIAESGIVYVLADESEGRLAPAAWAGKAIALYRRVEADAIIAEVNMGGEMVAQVLRQVDHTVPVRQVRATRGKFTRAEPVAALYARGKVRHVGSPLRELEDQMCDFGLEGLSDGTSPDRLDALVWAITALTLRGSQGPRITFL